MKMTVIHPYNGERVRVQLTNFGPSRTKQSMKAECDINNILARYQKTGTIAHIAKHEPTYGFAPAIDYRTALETVRTAEAMFMDLPAKARLKFGNDPYAFLAYVQDPENLEEMRATGLAKPAPTPPATPPTPPSDDPPVG